MPVTMLNNKPTTRFLWNDISDVFARDEEFAWGGAENGVEISEN